MSDGTPVVSVTEYIGVLRRWSRILAGATVAGALLGGGLSLLQPASYVAESIVQVYPLVSNEDTGLDVRRQISAETEIAVARSQRVAERAVALRRAAADLGVELDDPEVVALAAAATSDAGLARSALDRLSVSSGEDSHILVFEATGSDGESARSLAQSSAVAYLELRREAALTGRERSRSRLEARESQLVTDLTGQAADLGRDSIGLAYADIAGRQELTIIGSTYANLQALSAEPGVVLTDAADPVGAEGLPLYAGPMVGGLLGLVAALTAVFLLDRSDDRLRSGRAELAALGVPMLGTAPIRRTSAHGVDDGSGEGDEGSASRLFGVDSVAGDAYRRLQSTLSFSLESTDKSLVVVAGVTDAVTTTSVAANLAATAAWAGRRTLVVDGNLRDARLARHLGVSVESGLSEVILDAVRLSDAVATIDGVVNLALLAAGNQLDRPADVLRSQAFARLMAAVGVDYDLVVVEAPPVLRVADAVDVARLCHGAVLVADGGSDTRQSIAESVDQLRGVGVEIVGVVVADDGRTLR